MKSSTLFRIVLAASLLGLTAAAAAAQETGPAVSGYTSIDYDEYTDTVMAYSETDLDYDLIGDYQAYVGLSVTQDGSSVVASGSARDDYDDGFISIEFDFAGNPDSTYTATGSHRAYAELWDYDDFYPYRYFYYDDWYFTYFEGSGIYDPWYHWFYSPGYRYFTRRSRVIPVGSTYDSASLTIPYAHPINFRQVGAGTDVGNGVLHFDYDWDSSTGNKADLSDCVVTEYVTYPGTGGTYTWPHPPFDGSTPNPTILPDPPAPGTGTLQDNHSPKPFVTPYSYASFTAKQYYRYKCGSHDWIKVTNLISIVRTVSQNPGGSWKYVITKSGSSATIDPLP